MKRCKVSCPARKYTQTQFSSLSHIHRPKHTEVTHTHSLSLSQTHSDTKAPHNYKKGRFCYTDETTVITKKRKKLKNETKRKKREKVLILLNGLMHITDTADH